ncbi:hypothetical protein ACLESO_21655 [Pyxidicoccus sp. 3LG]
MRDSKRVMGVLGFLAALPAWASDMCALGALVFLPPVFLWAFVVFLMGLLVRKPGTRRVSWVLLVIGALPTVVLTFTSLIGAFHGSELKHDQMFTTSAVAGGALVASYVWAIWRFLTVPREPQHASVSKGPHPV